MHSGEDCGCSMEYNWLTSHDPITIDANLAEIDFDDFKNEDIQNAYAFSLQSYVSISMEKHTTESLPLTTSIFISMMGKGRDKDLVSLLKTFHCTK